MGPVVSTELTWTQREVNLCWLWLEGGEEADCVQGQTPILQPRPAIQPVQAWGEWSKGRDGVNGIKGVDLPKGAPLK